MIKITGSIIKKIKKPLAKAHKGDNGILTIIAGSKKYHGAPLLAINIASRFVDLVYFYSNAENQKLANKLKLKSSCFINITNEVNLETSLLKSDAILIGSGLEVNKKNKLLINKIIKKNKNKKFILDAGALAIINKINLSHNIIITPHADEYKQLFGKMSPLEVVKKYKITLVLKGKTDIVATSKKMYYNTTGNSGMTKGGTGDVLAGLIAALACNNNALLASCAGVYLNGLAGDALKKKVGYFYNADDLLKIIPQFIK
ncbi:MAG: NAD(P)H-hydrate dehydratase [Patescibacteria group bacterium]